MASPVLRKLLYHVEFAVIATSLISIGVTVGFMLAVSVMGWAFDDALAVLSERL